MNQLNSIIDRHLPGRPQFESQEVVIGNETLDVYYRDILLCIRSLYGDPAFAHDLIVAPEKHYTNGERTCRIYNEIYTGDWWWAVQVRNMN